MMIRGLPGRLLQGPQSDERWIMCQGIGLEISRNLVRADTVDFGQLIIE